VFADGQDWNVALSGVYLARFLRLLKNNGADKTLMCDFDKALGKLQV